MNQVLACSMSAPRFEIKAVHRSFQTEAGLQVPEPIPSVRLNGKQVRVFVDAIPVLPPQR